MESIAGGVRREMEQGQNWMMSISEDSTKLRNGCGHVIRTV